jgi:hypothetical protein
MTTTQYWMNAQKLRFVSPTLGTHICVHNPTTYNMVPLTKAQAAVPLQAGPNVLIGGVEFSPGAIPIEWPEMDYSEYQALQPFVYMPITMIDMYDNGYLGWLILGSYEPPAGVATKVGSCKATFVVSQPANGLLSTINVLTPGALSATVAAGGSIPSSTTLYYAMTFWSQWGESTMSPVKTVSTGATNNAMVQLSWTPPSSAFYRKARLYVSSVSFSAGSIQNIKAEVYTSFSQSFKDYCGTNGLTSTATIPTANKSSCGFWRGAVWLNES